MASLTITVPDIVVPRIREAMGHFDGATQQWVPATIDEITATLKAFVRLRVSEYETSKAAMLKQAEIKVEDWL